MIEALSLSRKINVIRTKHGNFLDYNALFKVVYNDLKGLVTKNHIFTCDDDNDNELWMSIRESNLEDCNEMKHMATKQGQRSRANLEVNINWLLEPIIPLGINPYKLVELYATYCPVVPEDYWEDRLYLKPANRVFKSLRRRRSSKKTIEKR